MVKSAMLLEPCDALPALPSDSEDCIAGTTKHDIALSTQQMCIRGVHDEEEISHYRKPRQAGHSIDGLTNESNETIQFSPVKQQSSFQCQNFPSDDPVGVMCRQNTHRQVNGSEFLDGVAVNTIPCDQRHDYIQVLNDVLKLETQSLQTVCKLIEEENQALHALLNIESVAPSSISVCVASIASNTMVLQSMITSELLSIESISRVSRLARLPRFLPAIAIRYELETSKAADESLSTVSEPGSSKLNVHETILRSLKSLSFASTAFSVIPNVSPSIVRFNATQLNRFRRNATRILELDLEARSLALCQSANVVRMNSTMPTLSRLCQSNSCKQFNDLLLSSATLVSITLVGALEMRVQYLVPSAKLLRKQKSFRTRFKSISERERCYRLIHLHILTPQHRTKRAFSPQLLSRQTHSFTSRVEPNKTQTNNTHTIHQHNSALVSFSGSFPQIAYNDAKHCPNFPIDVLAQLCHRAWTAARLACGWTYDTHINGTLHTHPDLVAFDKLSSRVQQQKRNLVQGTCDAILALGFRISEPHFEDPLICLRAISVELHCLIELLAEHIHDMWAHSLIAEGWTFGRVLHFATKQHPNLVRFSELRDRERSSDRQIVSHVLGALFELGYAIESQQTFVTSEPKPKSTFQHCLSV